MRLDWYRLRNRLVHTVDITTGQQMNSVKVPTGLIGFARGQGPGSRRVSNGLNNIRRATKVFGTKLRGHVGFVGCFCS